MKARPVKVIVILVLLGLMWQQISWAEEDLLRASPSAMLRVKAWGERGNGDAPLLVEAEANIKKTFKKRPPKSVEAARVTLKSDTTLSSQIKSLSTDINNRKLLSASKQESTGETFDFRIGLSDAIGSYFQRIYSGSQEVFYNCVIYELPLLIKLLDDIAARLEKENKYTNSDVTVLVKKLPKSILKHFRFRVANAAVAS